MTQGTLNILIADDDKGDIEQFKRVLDKSGLSYECTSVMSIEEALTACNRSTFDCVVLDYLLPVQTGLEGIALIRAQFPYLPVIMLTGSGDERVATEAMKRGASDYIVKENLTPELLNKSISSSIDRLLLKKQVLEQETRIDRISYRDRLTDIPNRFLFEYALTKALEAAKIHKKLLGILLIDIDRFKNINTTLGLEIGDALLKQLVARFETLLTTEDMLARLGSDEFVILIPELKAREDAGFLAQKILHALEKPFLMNYEKIYVTASIGIATYPFAGDSVFDLMRRMDTAMYQAKWGGRNNFQFYLPEFDKKIESRYRIEHALYNALDNHEFYLMYQPIYNLADNTVFGVEPLLCWKHAEFGKIPIDEITSVAEDSHLIVSINNWMMDELFRQCQACQLKGASPISLVLNLSPRQLNVVNWLSHVKKLMEKYKIDPRHLIFELLQTEKMIDMPMALNVLPAILEAGARIFIDDIGMTPYSINMLKNVSISGLKIHKLFIKDIEDNIKDRNFLKSFLMFADNMGFDVIIEGVETKVQLDFLKFFTEGKCKTYYLSHALPLEDMEKLLLECGK